MSGFHQFEFAAAFGKCLHLENANGWVCQRDITSDGLYDYVSPYPMFAETQFDRIALDFDFLSEQGAVSLTLRTDALSEKDVIKTKADWDWFKAFKTHHICDLNTPWRNTAHRNAIRYDRQARKQFDYSIVNSPVEYAAGLLRLNSVILQRTRGTADKAMTQTMMEELLSLTGCRLVKAQDKTGIQALGLFMISQENAYAYLLGCTNEARDEHVISGLYGYALDTLANDVRYVDFGSSPGIIDDKDHRVAKFKSLWSNQTAKSYICGKVLRPDIYAHLVKTSPATHSNFFPQYKIS